MTDVVAGHGFEACLIADLTGVSAQVIVGLNWTLVVGPNGAGKSTFLKAALGLIPMVSGEVRFFGQALSKARPRIAYVPQRASVDWDFPTTVIDVVLMGRYRSLGLLRRVSRADMARSVAASTPENGSSSR